MDADDRFSAGEVLIHPWITGEAARNRTADDSDDELQGVELAGSFLKLDRDVSFMYCNLI